MRSFTTMSPFLFAAFALVALSACVPADEDILSFELEQRSSIYLSNFDITVDIGDIERGRRVDDVEISDDGRDIAREGTMYEGDYVEFEHEGERYRLTVVNLVDRFPSRSDPFPDDWGTFELERLAMDDGLEPQSESAIESITSGGR